MITEREVQELLEYAPKKGKLYWRHTRGGRQAGTEAGTTTWRGQRIIKLHGKTYTVQRLVWLLEYGYVPSRVCHRDGNPQNNFVLNLYDPGNELGGAPCPC